MIICLTAISLDLGGGKTRPVTTISTTIGLRGGETRLITTSTCRILIGLRGGGGNPTYHHHLHHLPGTRGGNPTSPASHYHRGLLDVRPHHQRGGNPTDDGLYPSSSFKYYYNLNLNCSFYSRCPIIYLWAQFKFEYWPQRLSFSRGSR